MAEQSYSSEIPVTATAVLSLTGGAATQRTLPFMQAFKITQVRILTSTAVTVAASTITLNREINYGSATNQVAIGVMTIPFSDGAIGTVICAHLHDVADTLIMPGEGVSFVTNGVSTAGAAWCSVLGYYYGDSRVPNPVRSFSDVAKPLSGAGEIKYAAFTAT